MHRAAGLQFLHLLLHLRLLHIDDDAGTTSADPVDFNAAFRRTDDAIACVCASEKLLVLARESGVLKFYNMPLLTYSHQTKLQCRPYQLEINCNST